MRSVLSFLARSTRRGRASAGELREDVLAHLQRMCMTRQGSCPTAPLYGLPDLTDVVHSAMETAALVGRALAFTIETYEPRLCNVRVEHVPGDGADNLLRFSISARLIAGDRSLVKFATRVDPSRRVLVD